MILQALKRGRVNFSYLIVIHVWTDALNRIKYIAAWSYVLISEITPLQANLISIRYLYAEIIFPYDMGKLGKSFWIVPKYDELLNYAVSFDYDNSHFLSLSLSAPPPTHTLSLSPLYFVHVTYILSNMKLSIFLVFRQKLRRICVREEQSISSYVPVPRSCIMKITQITRTRRFGLRFRLFPSIQCCQHFCAIIRRFRNLLTDVASFTESERIQWFNVPSSNWRQRYEELWPFICFKSLLDEK